MMIQLTISRLRLWVNDQCSYFMAWTECNRQYKWKISMWWILWKLRMAEKGKSLDSKKKGFSIGRLYHVALGCGERYYQRTLLNFVKGPTSFEDIRTVNEVILPTFKDACYWMRLLDDDKEYIYRITEASFGDCHCI